MSRAYFFLKLIKYLKDKNVKWTHKAFFILPFLYAVSPITIIPYYFFPLAGLLDNIFVLLAGIYYIKKTIDDYDPDNPNKSEKNKRDNVIDINRDDYDVD